MESPTGNERRTLPTPPEILALRRGWYALIGGEKGCPRKRFFPLMLTAAALVELVQPLFVGELIPRADMRTHLSDMSFADIPLIVGAILAQAASCICGGLFEQGFGWLVRVCGVSLPGFESAWLNIYLGGTVILLCGLQMVVLACRRLRDAGHSRRNLLAGLSYALWPGLLSFGGLFLYLLLSNLGGFWLLRLYCQPTKTPVSAEESNAGTNAA